MNVKNIKNEDFVNKKLFLPLLLLLTLQIPNSIIAMGEGATDFEWSDKQADSQKFRNDSVQEKFNDMVLNDRNRTIDAKREKLRQAISKGDVEATKRWSSAFKPEETHHVKLALNFAKTKVELDEMNKGKQNKRTESQVENQIKIKNHLESLFAKEKAAAKKTESVPATPRNESVDSNQQAPATPPATPRAESIDSKGDQGETPKKTGSSLSDAVKKTFGQDDESQAKKKQDALKKKQDSFMSAAQKGDVKELTKLLTEKGSNIDINAKNSSGETALMIAAKKGDIATLKALLALKGPDGKTPLVDFNAKDSNGDTALTLAAKKGDIATLTALLTEKSPDSKPLVDVNAKNSSGDTALMIAAKEGDVAILQALLAEKGPDSKPIVDVNAQDSSGDTVLTIAAKKGNLGAVREILKRQTADIAEMKQLIKDTDTQLTTLMRADEENPQEIRKARADISKMKKQLDLLQKNITDQYKSVTDNVFNSDIPDSDIVQIIEEISKRNFKLSSIQEAKLTKIQKQVDLNNELSNAIKMDKPNLAQIEALEEKGAKVTDPKLQQKLDALKSRETQTQENLNRLLTTALYDRYPNVEYIKNLIQSGAKIDPNDDPMGAEKLAKLKSDNAALFQKKIQIVK